MIDAVWTTRSWTTDPPTYLARSEWAVRIDVTAAEPLREALLVASGRERTLQKLEGRGEGFSIDPGYRAEVEPAVDARGNPWLVLGLDPPHGATTWTPIPLTDHASERVELFAVPRRDTELLRSGRWRVRPDCGVTSAATTNVWRTGRDRDAEGW